MLEWLKRHAWKACSRLKRLTGSNPVLSAVFRNIFCAMILKFEEMGKTLLPQFKEGKKELAANMFFDGTNRIFKGCLCPGASIGVHTHDDSCEVIFIISGKGILHETADVEKVGVMHSMLVSQGDCLYCPKGSSHSLENPSDAQSDLVFHAVVAKQ